MAALSSSSPTLQVSGELVLPSSPLDGCDLFEGRQELIGKIPLIVRGGCMFIDKVKNQCVYKLYP